MIAQMEGNPKLHVDFKRCVEIEPEIILSVDQPVHLQLPKSNL